MDKVVHFEIPYETEENKDFYKDIFGWKFTDFGNMGYTVVHTAEIDKLNNNMPKEVGVINGGFYKKDEKSPAYPVIVINVEDIENKIEQIIEAGGEIFREIMEVGGMGRYAQVKDLDGNVIGIWQELKK